MAIYVIDAVAAIFVLIGYHVAFRQKLMLAWVASVRRSKEASSTSHAQAAPEDPEGVASVFRIAGVMIMAFSFTIGTFANLIAYYTSISAS